MLVLEYSAQSQSSSPYGSTASGFHVLLAVPGQQRQVQNKCDPVPVDEEEESQECVDGGFGDDIGVEAVAEIDGVDIVTGAKLACVEERRRAELCRTGPSGTKIDGRRQCVALTIPSRCTLW